MTGVYLFCLVVGGGLAGLSLLGDFFDADADVDADFDADLDVDGDFDGDTDSDTGSEAFKIFSIRSLTYGMFAFGLVGMLLTWLTPARFALTLITSSIAGLISLFAVAWLLGKLKQTEIKQSLDDRRFVSARAKVQVPLDPELPTGTVAVLLGERAHVLRAMPFERSVDPTGWKDVVVVELKGDIALVVPFSDDPGTPG